MRIIDADKLIEDIEKIARTDMMKVLVENWINKQPTAFDVDKVVKELEWHSKKYEKLAKVTNVEFPQECFRKGISYGYRDAIDIVKAGGISD